MTGPFPETVQVPPGLAQTRLIWGLPPVAWGAVLIGTVAPVTLIGWWGLAVMPLTVGFGGWVAYEAHKDPDFLPLWLAEMRLKRLYR